MARSRVIGSALYQLASRKIRDAARREFARTTVGKFVQEARRAGATGRRMERQLEMLYARLTMNPGHLTRELKQIAGVGQVSRGVERYAKSYIQQAAMSAILKNMGPLGLVIQSIMNAGRSPTMGAVQRELDAAEALLQAFGYHVRAPSPLKGRRPRSKKETEQIIDAAKKVLEEAGYRIVPPEEVEAEEAAQQEAKKKGDDPYWRQRGRRLPFDTPQETKAGKPRRTVEVNTPQGKRRFKIDHPAITGENVMTPESSNVHSYRYNVEKGLLYVRFKAPAEHGGARPNAPGPLYEYSGVSATEFETLLLAPSKGTWVWDSLRIRGTVAGYQKPYRLAGITGGYVPRHAVLKIGKQGLGEYYAPRRFDTSVKSFYSSKTESLVRSLKPGQINRGQPSRGAPNRGTPNRGRP